MPYISVIIPCYNAANYVERCMERLLSQTIGFENLEIIFINDGSLDATLGKLMQYEMKYQDQVILINCDKNYGQGAARNTGLKYASAEYIGFLDVDDVIADTFYEKLYRKIKEGNFDWVSAKFVHLFSWEQPDFTEPAQKNDREYHCETIGGLAFQTLDEDMKNGEFGVLPSRVFRKDFILENEIWFPEGLKYEDNYWGTKCEVFSKNVSIIDEVLYCYYRNENSTVSSIDMSHLDRMQIEEMAVNLFKEQGLFERYYEQIEARFIRMYYCGTWFAIFLKMNVIPDVLPVMRKRIYEWFPNFMENPLIKEFHPLDQMMLRLLESEDGYTIQELECIKEGYVKDASRSYNNMMGIGEGEQG